jgi:hypothetical protein
MRTPEITLAETTEIAVFLSIEIALKWLFLPPANPMAQFTLHHPYPPIQWANFALNSFLIFAFWLIILAVAKLLHPQARPTRYMWLSWFFFPLNSSDIFAAILAIIFSGKHAAKNSESIKKIVLSFVILLATITALAGLFYLTKTNPLNCLRLEIIILILLTTPIISIIKKVSPLKISTAILLFTLACALYRRNLPEYFLANILVMILTGFGWLLAKEINRDETANRPLYLSKTLVCTAAANGAIFALTALLIAVDHIFKQVAKKIPELLAHWLASSAQIIILMLSGWVFAAGDAATYPKIFILYTIFFLPFFFLPSGWITTLGQAAAIISAAPILMINALYWISIPCAGAILYTQATQKKIATIRTASGLVTLTAAITFLLIY